MTCYRVRDEFKNGFSYPPLFPGDSRAVAKRERASANPRHGMSIIADISFVNTLNMQTVGSNFRESRLFLSSAARRRNVKRLRLADVILIMEYTPSLKCKGILIANVESKNPISAPMVCTICIADATQISTIGYSQ